MGAVGNSRGRTEARRKPRRHFNYTAKILLDKEGPPHRCSISDISAAGARLVLENDCELPDRFLLLLSEIGTAHRRCRLVWRTGLTVGVEFPGSN